MLESFFEPASSNEDGLFIHFADDDIVIEPHHDIIRSNINFLESNPEIKIVSATYTSSDARGFSLISSARKQPPYVHSLSDERLLNLNGGCATTTVRRLKNLLDGDMSLLRRNGSLS